MEVVISHIFVSPIIKHRQNEWWLRKDKPRLNGVSLIFFLEKSASLNRTILRVYKIRYENTIEILLWNQMKLLKTTMTACVVLCKRDQAIENLRTFILKNVPTLWTFVLSFQFRVRSAVPKFH